MKTKKVYNHINKNQYTINSHSLFRKGDFPPVNYENLLKAWSLKIINYKNIRAVLRVETDQGTYACKCFKYDPNLLNFIIQVIKHLKNNGFNNIMEIIPTIDGENYFQDTEGNIFILMPWINGREANLKDTKELFLTSQLMAKFHLASMKFSPQNIAKIPNSWGQWIEKYTSALKSLEDVKEIIINKTEGNEIDKIVKQYWKDYYLLTSSAIKTLENSQYKNYVKKAKKNLSLCHGDFTYHNILVTSNEELHLIDFDYLRCDTRTLDIGKFLRKELAHYNYDFNICELILRAYNEIYPLEKNEYHLLLAILLYPHKFMVNVLDYYLKNKKRPTKVILHRLRRTIEERYALDKFLMKFKDRYL